MTLEKAYPGIKDSAFCICQTYILLQDSWKKPLRLLENGWMSQ